MKKIAFALQVLTLAAALPVLSFLELTHAPGKTTVTNKESYSIPAEKSLSYNSAASGKIPVIVEEIILRSKPGA